MARGAGLQLTTLLRHVTDATGRGSPRPLGVVPGDEPSDESGPHVVRATAARARSLLPAGARTRYDALVSTVGEQDDDGRDVLARTLAATWSLAAVAEMATRWSRLPGPVRAAVHDPVRALGRAGRQSDRTTCGSAVLTMLAALGDPALAVWLATGDLVRSGRPPELVGAPARRLAALADASPEDRFAPVQRVVKRRTNARALLGLPWPTALGTPPWGAAREARFAGLTFTHTPVDDTDRAGSRAVLDAVGAALDRGVPVPLYSGGDLRQGIAATVPRHLVLALGRHGGRLRVWEPATGRTLPIDEEVLLDPPGPLPALGGWTHLTWAVLPVL